MFHSVFPYKGGLDQVYKSYTRRMLALLLLTMSVPFLSHSSAFAQAFFCPNTPRAIAAGDFNGDGKLDVALVRQGSRSVFVYPGDGHGGLGAPNAGSPSPPQASTLVAADFIPGGNFEIVAANAVFTLIGTFTTLAVGDFNGDGKLDVALADGYTGVSVYLQTANGTLSRSFNSTSVFSGPADIAVGDFNGDGRLDFAVAKRGDPFLQLLPGHEVAIFFGNGAGGFTRQPDIQTGGDGPQSIVTGDFNHDGFIDLAVLHFYSNDVSILLGDGQGHFTPSAQSPIPLPAGDNGASLLALDFDGDGNIDLAAATTGDRNVDNRIVFLLGNGHGGFQASLQLDPGFPPRSIVAGDFDGNGRPDLATGFFCGTDVKVLLNPFPPPDAIAPTTAATPNPPPNANGWNNTNVTVSLNATDNPGGSGVKEIQFSFSGAQLGSGTVSGSTASVTISGEGTTVLTYFAKDNAGNQEAPKTLTVKIDKTAPTITGARSPGPNANGWNNTDVTVTFTCSDSTSGIDTCGPTPQVVTTEGMNQSRTGTAVDKAGNTASATVSGINIDKTPPNAPTASVSPAPNAAGWNNTNVTVSFTSNGDAGTVQSGVDTCTSPTTLTSETAGTTVSGTCTDKAGNTSAAASVTIRIDKTPPTTTATPSPAPNGVGFNNTNVTVTLSAVDTGGSGVKTITFSASGAQTIPTTTVTGATAIVPTITAEGTTTLTFFATDNADNQEAAKTLTIKIDRTAPELEARCAPPSQSPFVSGRNGATSVTLIASGPLLSGEFTRQETYRILDDVGNRLDATFAIKSDDHSIEFAVISLAYNGAAPTTPPSNSLKCEWDFDDLQRLEKLDQDLEIDSQVDVDADFDRDENRTVIKIERPTPETTVVRPGVVFLQLTTSAGQLGFAFMAPTTTATPTPAPNAAGFNNTNVTVTLSATDTGGSGVKNITFSASGAQTISTTTVTGATTTVTITAEGTTIITFFAIDNADNQESQKTLIVKIDKTAPTTTATPSPAPDANGFNNTDVTVTLSATDLGGSGVREIRYALNGGPETVVPGALTTVSITAEGTTTVTYRATDNADNQEAAKTLTIKIDRTAPTTTATPSPAPNAAGFNNTDVTVTLSATDTGGSGVKNIIFSASGAQTISTTTVTGATTTVTITAEGTTTLTFFATDNDGNQEAAKTLTVKIDKTAPTTTATPSPTPNANGWNNTNVTINFSATDSVGGSGVKEISISLSGAQTQSTVFAGNSASVVVSAEGVTTITYFAKDIAGNQETAKTLTVRIDKTAPELAVRCAPPSTSPFLIGRDGNSGITSVTLTGSFPLNLGEFTRKDTFTILDQAGNRLDAAVGVKPGDNETEFTLISLSYNGGAPVSLPENELECKWAFNQDTLKKLDQDLKIKSPGVDIDADFRSDKNQTVIAIHYPEPETQVTRPGVVSLFLTTNLGQLGFDF